MEFLTLNLGISVQRQTGRENETVSETVNNRPLKIKRNDARKNVPRQKEGDRIMHLNPLPCILSVAPVSHLSALE